MVLLLLTKKVVLQHEVPQPVRHEVEQGVLATLPIELDSIGDTNIQALKEELARKEATLGELWESSQALVESRGTEI